MTPADIDRVFGRGRLRMVTGDHVEVFREGALPGERRRYTKRFLATAAGDFRHWTEREWRILARLVGHGIGPVPDVVQFDRGAADRPALVQTYDAGVTVDHWATLLPVERAGGVQRHVFEDCAHWWALARHSLIALDAIHELQVVHLDLKADNVCIPLGPADFDPHAEGQLLTPQFEQIALIDFAFSLVSGESLTSALPIARQADYDYQSPRLLQALEAGRGGDLSPTRQLDWRCDVFSLAAMLRRYLPDPDGPLACGWSRTRYAQARTLVRRLLEAHDAERPALRPHGELVALTARALDDADLAASLLQGWTLATRDEVACDDSPTPVTRIALPVAPAILSDESEGAPPPHTLRPRNRMRSLPWAAGMLAAAAIGAPLLGQGWLALQDRNLRRHAEGVPTPPKEGPTQVLAGTPEVLAAPPQIDETSSDTAPYSNVPVTPAASPAPTPPIGPALSSAMPTPADVPSTGAEPGPATASTAPALAARAPKPRPPATMAGRGVAPGAAADRTAAAAVPAPVRPSARAVAPPATRPPVRSTARITERERAMASLTLRGPAPLSAQGSAASSPATPAPAPLPVQVMAAAPAPAPAVVVVPAYSPQPGPGVAPPPAPARAGARIPPPPPADLTARANALMAEQVPRIVQLGAGLVQRVLNIADHSDSASQDDEIRSAASAIRLEPNDPLTELGVSASEARRLNDAAAFAYSQRRNVQEALGLQFQAFGANPLDPEIAGNLAFIFLRQNPPQADAARQLALHALMMHSPQNPAGRVQDWTTFAIASALSGRGRDARNAWLVTLAVAPNLEHQCKVAINAYAMYGERLRSPVEAMLYSAHSSGRSGRSGVCEWPAHWMATSQTR